VSHDGERLVHRTMNAAPAPFLKAIAPYRDGLVVAVACPFTWSWLADLCAQDEIPCGLGQARSMKAMPGGKATQDTLDSPKLATLLRGGMRPTASVYPAERRATRDLLRRRTHLRRKRAERLAHGQHTNSQYNLPDIGPKIADNANREGVAARLDDPAVRKTMAIALERSTDDDQMRSDLALFSLKTAQPRDAQTLSLFQTGPGIGNILSLVVLYEIHQSDRFPRGQDFASYCRLVTCAKASGGKRLGPAGNKIGNAHLKGAVSEAATLFRRGNEPGQKSLPRLEKKHDHGKALSLLAPD